MGRLGGRNWERSGLYLVRGSLYMEDFQASGKMVSIKQTLKMVRRKVIALGVSNAVGTGGTFFGG